MSGAEKAQLGTMSWGRYQGARGGRDQFDVVGVGAIDI